VKNVTKPVLMEGRFAPLVRLYIVLKAGPMMPVPDHDIFHCASATICCLYLSVVGCISRS
jgi:hypothetical protein